MPSYRKILVPIDASNKSNSVINEAIGIAKQYGSTIVALYVLPFSPLSYRNVRVAEETMYDEGKIRLAKLKELTTKNKLSIQTKILKGHLGQLITNFANQKKNSINLIAIGSRDLGGLKEMFLGSVSNFVVHKSKVSVMAW